MTNQWLKNKHLVTADEKDGEYIGIAMKNTRRMERKWKTRKQKSRLKGSFLGISGGPDGARTRDLRRDRPAF